MLIGADGVRSAVRAALVANERAFECSVADIFTNFKSVHLPLPAAVAEKRVVVLPQCLKGINGAWPQREAAVATGGLLTVL